jgi:hypothetical protein
MNDQKLMLDGGHEIQVRHDDAVVQLVIIRPDGSESPLPAMTPAVARRLTGSLIRAAMTIDPAGHDVWGKALADALKRGFAQELAERLALETLPDDASKH